MKKGRKRYRQPKAQMSQKRQSRHHMYHPKRLYSEAENVIIWVSSQLHRAYNSYFDHNCKKNAQERECHYGMCEFAEMCCYHQSQIAYGQRLI